MDAWQQVRRHGDTAFAVTITAALQAAVWTDSTFAGEQLQNAAAALVFGVSLFLRQRMPLVPLLGGLTILVIPGLHELGNSGLVAVGIIASLYSCGVSPGRRVRAAALALGLLGAALAALTEDPFSANDTVWVVLIVLAPWIAGRMVRRGRDRAGLLERQAVRLEEARDVAAAQATSEERLRIARELHDVVAHALSLIVVQARAGRRMIHRGRADEVLDGFDTIEHAAQEALVEMRRLLGLLRDDADDAALVPRPGLARLPELVAQYDDAGLRVQLETVGEPYELPAGVDVSAYRIVQEALTNVVRHSGATRAEVVIAYAPTSIDIRVVDDGHGAVTEANGGHGLIGIRERVLIYGGRIEAGSRPEGGFAIDVRFPTGATE